MGNNIRRQNRRKTKRETMVKISHGKLRYPSTDGVTTIKKEEQR